MYFLLDFGDCGYVLLSSFDHKIEIICKPECISLGLGSA